MSLRFLHVLDHGCCFVSLYSSLFVIVFGYLMPTILLRKRRWKTSILLFNFSFSVQIPLWYRNILVTKASKYFILSVSGRRLFVTMFWCLLKAALASPFLLAMSLWVSSFDPRRIMSFQLWSPLCLIEKRSVFSLLTHRLNCSSC